MQAIPLIIASFLAIIVVAVLVPAFLTRDAGTALWVAAVSAAAFAIFGPIVLPTIPGMAQAFGSDVGRGLGLEVILYVGTVWTVTLVLKLANTARRSL